MEKITKAIILLMLLIAQVLPYEFKTTHCLNSDDEKNFVKLKDHGVPIAADMWGIYTYWFNPFANQYENNGANELMDFVDSSGKKLEYDYNFKNNFFSSTVTINDKGPNTFNNVARVGHLPDGWRQYWFAFR